VLGGFAGGRDRGLAGNRDGAHARGVQVTLDGGLAVAAVGGDRAGHAAGAAGGPLDGRHQLRAVGGGAGFHAVVHDDAVVVIDDLRLFCRAAGNAALGFLAGADVLFGAGAGSWEAAAWSALSEGFEEGQERVVRSVAPGLGVERGPARKCPFFEGQVGVQVRVDGFEFFVAEP
jgi:hypothetical protein